MVEIQQQLGQQGFDAAGAKKKITFEPSSHILTADGKKLLREIAPILKQHPELAMQVEGHTGCKCIPSDASRRVAGSPSAKRARGADCKAIDLSENRARSCVEFLQTQGCQNKMTPV